MSEHAPSLEQLGFKAAFRAQLAALPDDAEPARVAVEQRGRYELMGGDHPYARVAPALARAAENRIALPAVGDWVGVAVRDGEPLIVHRFERSTEFVRKASGDRAEPQVIAANVDTVAIVSALTEDTGWTARARRSANPRRIERYLLAVEQSGASAVIVLNKADVCPDPSEVMQHLGPSARHVPLLTVSARDGSGMDGLRQLVPAGDTLAFVGMSGVGKSTLVNRLLGDDVADIGAERNADSRGRHTTTHRELHLVPGGGLLVDTPGMRELGMWLGAEGAIDDVFDDVSALAERCRFRDCSHEHEPGCAVQRAVTEGELTEDRVRSYRSLSRELDGTGKQALEAKRKWERDIAREVRRMRKHRKR